MINRLNRFWTTAVLLGLVMTGCSVEEFSSSDSRIQLEYAITLPEDFSSEDVQALVRSDLERGVARFLCSSSGSYDSMHVPGIEQEELDAIMERFDIQLVRFIWDGHEFSVTEEKVSTERVDVKYGIAEEYNRQLSRLVGNYPEFRRGRGGEQTL